MLWGFGRNEMFKKIKTGIIFCILYLKRKNQLGKKIPEIWNYKTVLYVGARKFRRDFTNDFRKHNYQIDILEIFDKNFESLKKLKWVNNLIKGDVKNIDKLINKKYDIVFWWHGPEHIYKKELKNTLNKLKKLTNHLVVCGCPYGRYEQGACYGNKWEKHLSYLDIKDFEKNGFETSTLGKKDALGNNLLAWWKK